MNNLKVINVGNTFTKEGSNEIEESTVRKLNKRLSQTIISNDL